MELLALIVKGIGIAMMILPVVVILVVGLVVWLVRRRRG